jgi:hypothetical protein
MPIRRCGTRLALLALCPFVLAACASVRAYEREYLTRPGMEMRGEGQAAEFEAHLQSSREGAVGGHGTIESSTGGGCGCN